jgi:hypothetical protein
VGWAEWTGLIWLKTRTCGGNETSGSMRCGD